MQEYYVEVGTSNYRDDLYCKLDDLRSKEGLPFELYEQKNGASYLVRCVYSTLKGKKGEDRLAQRIYNYYFAHALAEIIFKQWEVAFVKKILKKEYSMSYKDIEMILEKSWQDLNSHNTYLPATKKHILIKSILEFLDSNKRLNIEGFMNFRADMYKREVRKQIASAVNSYMLAQEHQSFISMLKKFIQKQVTIFSTIHLIIKPQGEVVFLDDRGRNINKACYSIPSDDKTNIELYEDSLISAILKCAPRRLVVHSFTDNHNDMIQIINEVFENKISFCTGCPLCRVSD